MGEMYLRASLNFDSSNGIDLPDESLDSIYICNPEGEKFEDSQKLMAEVARVLKKGGTASFDCYHDTDKEYLSGLLDTAMQLEASEAIEDSETAMTITLRKCEEIEKAAYTDKAWNGDKSRFSMEQLASAVPSAVLKWAKSQGELKKENLKLPYKEPDGTINLAGVRAALAAIGGARGNKPNLPAEVLKAAQKQLQGILNRAGGGKKDEVKKSDSLKETAKHPFDENNPDAEITALYKSGEERIVYYPVLEPYRLDADGHYFPPEVIADACEEFKKSHGVIDINHSKRLDLHKSGDVSIIDCFIAKGDETFMNHAGSSVQPRAGGWYIGLFVKSDKIWEGVKSGEYRAVSLGGSGEFVNGDVREVVFKNAA